MLKRVLVKVLGRLVEGQESESCVPAAPTAIGMKKREKGHDRGRTAFLIECSDPSWVSVAKHLARAGLRPAYWTAWSHSKAAIETAFEDVIFHDTMDAKRCIPHPEFGGADTSIFSNDCRSVWESEAQTVYEMMSRFDHSRDLTYIQMSLYFYRALAYWNSVLDELRPDVVIFPTAPHVVYDYILLCLCRAKHVPTVIFEQVYIHPSYSLCMREYRDGCKELKDAYSKILAEAGHRELSPEARAIINRINDSYDKAKPIWEQIHHRTMDADLSDEEFLDKESRRAEREAEIESAFYISRQLGRIHPRLMTVWPLNRIAGMAAGYQKQVNVAALAKERGVSLRHSFEGKFPNKRYMQQRLEQMLLTRQRHAFYKSLCKKPEPGAAKFIFLPLMFQPERSSCPQGGIFSNQFLIVNLLSNLAPAGWQVYVKEHPTQFHPNMQCSQVRSEEYYGTIARFNNVKLIDTDIDPFLLIDTCQAVATIGGTAAIEAVVRGKPALLFGYAYFEDCAGMYRVSSEADLRRALSQIREIPRVNAKDVEKYFHAIEGSLFRGYADANVMTEGIENNALVVADQILKQLEQNRRAQPHDAAGLRLLRQEP
jgi:hypothetical protein